MSRAYKPSEISLLPETATIHLSTGGVAFIDVEDVPKVSAFSWRVHPNGCGNVYASTRRQGRTIYLHRLVMSAGSKEKVDHIDGDGLNCRRSNMRLCTNAENARNSRRKDGHYKGVSRQRGRTRFEAVITTPAGKRRLGSFDTATEAAEAYDRAALLHHGEFASLNFPRPLPLVRLAGEEGRP